MQAEAGTWARKRDEYAHQSHTAAADAEKMVAQAAEAKTQLHKVTKDLEAAKQHLLALDRCVLIRTNAACW